MEPSYIYIYIYIYIHIYIYISQNLSYKRRTDLQICCPNELESEFIKVIYSPIYKATTYWVLSTSTHLWSTLSLIMNIWKSSWKQILYSNWWEYKWNNLNLLKHAKPLGVSKFLENLLSHKFMPQITLHIRTTEKMATLINDILINNNVLNSISGNITASISSFTSIHCLRESIRN